MAPIRSRWDTCSLSSIFKEAFRAGSTRPSFRASPNSSNQPPTSQLETQNTLSRSTENGSINSNLMTTRQVCRCLWAAPPKPASRTYRVWSEPKEELPRSWWQHSLHLPPRHSRPTSLYPLTSLRARHSGRTEKARRPRASSLAPGEPAHPPNPNKWPTDGTVQLIHLDTMSCIWNQRSTNNIFESTYMNHLNHYN